MIEKQKLKLEWWKFIVGSFLLILVAFIPLIWNYIANKQNKSPQFYLSSPIVQSDTMIKIFTQNNIVKKNNLTLEWDGYVFPDGAIISEKEKSGYFWMFTPKEVIKDKKLISNGSHSLRFSFNNHVFSNYIKISITDKNETEPIIIPYIEIKSLNQEIIDLRNQVEKTIDSM